MNRLLLIARYDTWFKNIKLIRWLFRVVLLIFLIFGLVGVSDMSQRIVFGLFFITLPIGILLDIYGLFLRNVKDQEENWQREHVTKDSLNYASALLIVQSQNNAKKLWFSLLHTPSITFLVFRLGLNRNELYKLLRQIPTMTDWINQAKTLAMARHCPLEPRDLFETIALNEPFISLWQSLGITEADREHIFDWYRRLETEEANNNRGIGKIAFSGSGIGRDWTSGYTQALDTFGFDLTRELKRIGSELDLVGHQHELRQIGEALSSSPPRHVLLIGDEGVGKKRVIYRLVSQIVTGEAPYQLQNKRVYMLDVGKLLTAPSQTELELQLHQVFDEAALIGNVIIVIPDIHLLVGQRNDGTLGAINATPIISQYLQSQALIITTTTPEAYFATIKPNQSLDP